MNTNETRAAAHEQHYRRQNDGDYRFNDRFTERILPLPQDDRWKVQRQRARAIASGKEYKSVKTDPDARI